VGIADAYALMPLNGNVSPSESLPKAKEAAQHALAIDPNLSEAHSALGRILLSYEYDFAGAEKELQRASELNPNSVSNKLWSVELLTASSRFTEAFATVRRAMELDPFSVPASGFVGRIYYYSGQYNESIAALHKTLELDENVWFLHCWLGMPLVTLKQYPEAIEEFEKSGEIAYEPELRKVYAEAMSGEKAKARGELETFVQLSKTRFVPAVHIARAYVRLGEKEKAFEWLDRAYDERDFLVVFLWVDRDFDPIRADPRFEILIHRIGIPRPTEQSPRRTN
jgi:tetratricopeptide (TPR) repeat protein